MKPADYRRYMASATWAVRKQRFFEIYRRQCVACGTSTGQIDLHHITYVRAPGNEADKDMVPLCAWCHAEVHRLERTSDKNLRKATMAVTGGQRPWRIADRPRHSKKAQKRKTHKSDRYRPLVSGFEATDRTKPQGDAVVRSTNYPTNRRKRKTKR